MMSIDSFMAMNMAACRYMPVEKDDDISYHNSSSKAPKIGTAGHNVLNLSKRFRADFKTISEERDDHRRRVTWEEALEQLAIISPYIDKEDKQ